MFHQWVRITWRQRPWGSGVSWESWEPVVQGGSFVEKPVQRLKHVPFISFASGLLPVETRCFVSLKNPLKTEMSQLIIPLSKTVKEMRAPRDADSRRSCLAPNRQNREEVSCSPGRKHTENYWQRGYKAKDTAYSLKIRTILPKLWLLLWGSGFQNMVPGPIASVSPVNLLGKQILGSHPRPTESETLGVGSRRPCLNQPCVWTRGFWWRPKLENCCWEHVAFVWLSMSFLIEAKILARKNTYCMTPLYEIQKQEKWIYAIEIRERLPWGEAL